MSVTVLSALASRQEQSRKENAKQKLARSCLVATLPFLAVFAAWRESLLAGTST
jgi:hypothetical protein